MEQNEPQNQELIDVECVLSFLSSLDADGTQEEVFHKHGHVVVCAMGTTHVQQAKNALNKTLDDFNAARKMPTVCAKKCKKIRSMTCTIRLL